MTPGSHLGGVLLMCVGLHVVSGFYALTWHGWGECSKSCGGGYQMNQGTCYYPCRDSKKTRHCNEQPCPVPGGWTAWSLYSSCSTTCGEGQRSRIRSCSNPEPHYGGAACVGVNATTEPCRPGRCPDPVDGKWLEWSAWGACSLTCEGGVQRRTRTCAAPTGGGGTCEGMAEDVRGCNLNSCGPMTNEGVTPTPKFPQRKKSKHCTPKKRNKPTDRLSVKWQLVSKI